MIGSTQMKVLLARFCVLECGLFNIFHMIATWVRIAIIVVIPNPLALFGCNDKKRRHDKKQGNNNYKDKHLRLRRMKDESGRRRTQRKGK